MVPTLLSHCHRRYLDICLGEVGESGVVICQGTQGGAYLAESLLDLDICLGEVGESGVVICQGIEGGAYHAESLSEEET